MPIHREMISSLTLRILQDQCDNLIPDLCQNFAFVPNLEINLNNFALNFDNLPQSKYVQNVSTLTVRKNKYLFHPLVTMAFNLQHLQIYFKEFTYEVQDLKPLKELKSLQLTCLVDSNKYFNLNEQQIFQLQFYKPQQVSIKIKMPSFNLEMLEIFKKFNWKKLNVKSLELEMNKLKYSDDICQDQLGNQSLPQNPKPHSDKCEIFSEGACQFDFKELRHIRLVDPTYKEGVYQSFVNKSPPSLYYTLKSFTKTRSQKGLPIEISYLPVRDDYADQQSHECDDLG